MSFRATAWALYDAPVTDPRDVLVLVALSDHSSDETEAHLIDAAAVARIARVARTSERDVRDRLDRLVDGGVLEVVDLTGELYRPIFGQVA